MTLSAFQTFLGVLKCYVVKLSRECFFPFLPWYWALQSMTSFTLFLIAKLSRALLDLASI